MLAHGTGVCQWLAVIVSLCLGGLLMHDPVVSSPMISFVEKDSGTNDVAAGNSRFKNNFLSPAFIVLNITWEAQECDMNAYPVEEDYLSTFYADSDATVDQLEAAENLRLRENFWGHGFFAPNNTYGAQECYMTVHLDWEDYLCTFNASLGVISDRFGLVDQEDHVDPFGCVFDHLDNGFQRQEYQGRVPTTPDFHVLLFCFVSNVFYAKWKKEHVLRLVTKSSDWMVLGQRRRLRYSYNLFDCTAILFWFILLGLCAPALGVTCQSCFDGIDGCAGGAACLFSTRTAANLAALTVVGGGAINVVSLLPSSYVRHLPTQVLRTLAAIARVPAADGPPDLGAMTLTDLQECLASGRIEINAYKAELSARLADPATVAAQVTRISAMLLGLQNNVVAASTRTIDGINSFGVLGYLVAAASLIVNSGKRTYSSGTTAGSGSSSATSGGTSLSIRAPTSGSQFAELLMVLQTLAHAVGAANILATTPFVQQIVWDGISTLGLLWEQAYCLFIIYLEAIEDSRGVLHVANVFAAGAQDTRLKAANKRYSEIFCQPCDDTEVNDKDRDKGSKKWNNKDSPNANGVCKTYNFKDASHPAKHLHLDGTCKFRHVCNHWCTGKGPGGMCEGNHPHYSCTNPNKTNTKPTA